MDLFTPDVFRLGLRYLYTGELSVGSPGVESLGDEGAAAGAAEHARLHAVPPTSEGYTVPPTSEGVAQLLELMRLGDYLELAHLKQRCERVLVDWDAIQVENVIDLYTHAAQCNCLQLKATCLQFIRLMFDVVRETDAYGALSEALRREVTSLRG